MESARRNDASSQATLGYRDAGRDAEPVEEELFCTREHETAAFSMTALSDEMVVAVSNKRCAYEIFQHLKKTYELRNGGNMCALRDQFCSAEVQGRHGCTDSHQRAEDADRPAHKPRQSCGRR